MSTHEQITNNPTSAVRNTGGRNGPQGLEEPMSDEVLREMCDKNYHQLLPLIAEKMQKEKEQKDKLNAVKARLIYGEESGIKIRSREESHYSESKTPTARTEPRRRRGDRYSRSPSPHASVFKRLKKYRSPSPRPRPRKEGGVFNRLGRKEPATSARSDSRQRSPQAKRTEVEARRRQQKGTPSHDLSQPWTCEERNPFTPRIRHFSLPRTRMPSHVKTYDGSGDPEDHLKLFQSAAKTEGWAMPTWCHMFNSTLTGNARVWFDKLPKESIDSYEDLRTAFRENYLQQTKHIKDPVEIHHIKQRDGESTEDFMERYKAEVLDVEGAPECMRISGFMHGITHPGLIKRLYKRIPRSMDEMYRMTTSFLVSKPRITQSFSPEMAMSFPPLREEDGTEGPMIIEVEMGGHFVHRVYIDGGASSEVLYEHCFIKLRKEIRDQMVPATTHLIGFSGETIWPLGQIALLVKIGDEVHSTSAWMNFMVIRSPSQHNAIIG
ncbi:reverse transcriptase domain-containing protein [Tanacetum coccineum]|uniref:Reverse transcriptase domain-containing protein n=1 Tax=Tanacetum coccineum TaxID=301880 RepID=A0ABQ5I5C8_9ASTR